MNLNNLPSANEQFIILKQQLDSYDFPDDLWSKFMNYGSTIPETINYIYERPNSGKILKYISLKPIDCEIEKILYKLAESLIRMWNENNKYNRKVMNVLAPSAMEDGTYLGYTFFADKLCLLGEASIYIREEESGNIISPLPVLTHSR